jgi:hypothetical protein
MSVFYESCEKSNMSQKFDECVRDAMADPEVLNGVGAIIYRKREDYYYDASDESAFRLGDAWAIIIRTAKLDYWILLPQSFGAVDDVQSFQDSRVCRIGILGPGPQLALFTRGSPTHALMNNRMLDAARTWSEEQSL